MVTPATGSGNCVVGGEVELDISTLTIVRSGKGGRSDILALQFDNEDVEGFC
jgi:hypothetical protein